MRSRIAERLRSGRPALGTWLSLGSAAVADVLGRTGFDFLLVDGQHSPIGPAEMSEISRAVLATGASPVIRVASLDGAAVAHALDRGAHAVMVPSVSTAEDARRAVELATFPPAGRRSIGGYGAPHAFGASRDEYLAAGAPALVVIQIEDAAAVDRLDQILAVPGIDVCFIGPQDLAASLGAPAQLDSRDPRYRAALERIVSVAKDRGVCLGILAGTIESAMESLDLGFRMVAVATDVRLLQSAADSIMVPLAGWSPRQ